MFIRQVVSGFFEVIPGQGYKDNRVFFLNLMAPYVYLKVSLDRNPLDLESFSFCLDI